MQQKQKKYTLIKASVVYENYVNLHGLGLDLLKMGGGGALAKWHFLQVLKLFLY
jgi:hypothetical protein